MKQEKRTLESYPTRNIRLSEETWQKLKDRKLKHGKSWNLFLLELLNKK